MKKTLLRLLAAACLLLLLGAGWIGWQVRAFLNTPPEAVGREVVFVAPPGAALLDLADPLRRQGLVTDAGRFRLLVKVTARLEKSRLAVKTGEYALRTDWTPERVLRELTQGKVLLRRVQIAEGLNWRQVGRLAEAAGVVDFASFAEAVRDPELLRKYGVPFPTAEGFLFPETYLLPRALDNDARPVVEAMLKEFRRRIDPLLASLEGQGGAGRDPDALRRLVVLASLVEKETAAPEERARVAGVYAARLEKSMPLQCDPTVIYGLGDSFDGNLRRRDLDDETNLYNTYRHAGLPPGPICSPGEPSLRAAAAPERHDFLYFVAKEDGTHHFSQTLVEHNQAVRKYQLGKSGR